MFRKEFTSIRSKANGKLRFRGRFSDTGGKFIWKGIPLQEFGENMKSAHELHIQVRREGSGGGWE
jgi:hypothetical protein